MSTADEAAQARAGEICIDASQLRPGVHVRLPMSWMAHHFLFNSFVIETEAQARQIAAMGLPQLFCDVARCKVPPLPKEEDDAPPDQPTEAERAELAAAMARQMAEKTERIQVMRSMRERLDTTQKHFFAASKSVDNAFKSFDQKPKESIGQISRVSENSTRLLMTEVDSAIVLIAEKGQSDGFAAHALSVMTLAQLLGKQARLPEKALRTLGIGALLHDIGELVVNKSILRNAERNKHEEAVYQTHCRVGYESMLRTGGLSEPSLEAILHHHERFDGTGFPDKLSGEDIHIAARVIAIANRFDNLANPMDYRRAMSPSEALSTMWVREKKAFDPLLLQLFVRAMGVYPPGSIVQLSDGRVGAVVVSASTATPLCPQIMIFDAEIPRHQAIIIDLANDSSVKIDRALHLRDRPGEELEYLLPRRKMNWFHAEGPA